MSYKCGFVVSVKGKKVSNVDRIGYALHLWAISFIFIVSSTVSGADFVKGADISWVPGQESTGIVFKDSSGKQRDIIDILKNDYQINTIRLRVFVNPSNDWGNGMCDIASTVGMAKRVKTAGMQLMLSLHYSDSWADPSKQNPPAAWKNYTVTQLETAVYSHTKEVMEALSKEGIYPLYVQIGNETNNGMLWENGKASTATGMSNYARFVTAGNKAVKEISSSTQTVVHVSNGFDNSLFSWNIGGLITNGAKFDVIGMSAYPEYAPNTTVDDWADFNSKVFSNVASMISTYKKPVILSETGMHYTAQKQCQNMLSDMIVKLRAIKNNMGLGVLYWEPQAGPGYNRGYNLGAWDANGRPTQALKGFIENKTSIQQSRTFYSSEERVTTDIFRISSNASVTLCQLDGRSVYKGPGTDNIRNFIPGNGVYFLNVNRSGLSTKYSIVAK